MPRGQHHPHDIKRFNQGANRDIEDEYLGALDEGEYIDANNLRPTRDTGNQAALEKIDGEEQMHANNLGGTTYKCLRSIEVNDRIVELWVDTEKVLDSLIRVDGNVVLKSPDFPISIDNPGLQVDKNESCVGGEIYITDNFNRPMIFNVQDMVDNFDSGSTKYFADFNISQFILTLETALDHPVFVERVNVGAGGGLPAGTYQYAIRFVTEDGDRTAFSVSTPLIPVPAQASSASAQYPNIKTVGSSPSSTVQTGIGLKIRFRINNLLDYDFVEVKRVAFNAGQPLGTIPNAEIIARIDIDQQEVSVKEFIDPVDQTQAPEVITDEEDTEQMSAIKRCKTLRYYEQRLHLMNIEFESRDIDNTNLSFLQVSGNEMFEVIQDLGTAGYNSSYNHAYYQHYQTGEKYGFGIVGYDERGERTFTKKVPNFSNYQFQNRRDELGADTINNSPLGTVTASSVDGNNTDVAEVFDLTQSVRKTDFCEVKNIATAGDKAESKVNKIFQNTGSSDPCVDIEGTGLLNRVTAEDLGYQPYRPTTSSDNTTSHDFQVNPEVDLGAQFAGYQPRGYAPRYYSHGIALAGLDDIPSYMKAFSVVRTERAGRVVTQGIGMYNLDKANVTSGGGRIGDSSKGLDSFWFFSPDIENGFVPAETVQDMIDNPSNYEIQLVSPVGFFSEVYTGNNTLTQNEGVDIISYARILFEDGNINIGDTTGSVGDSGYVTYGKWRNLVVNPNASGTTVYTMQGFNDITNKSGLQTFYELSINQAIYASPVALAAQDFDDVKVKNFHEPFYIINIIQTGKNVPDTDVTEYRETGHYQKVESIIGKSDGVTQDYILVDERWEDCIPALDSSHPTSGDDRYIWVEDDNGQQFRWQNVTFKTPAQITTIIAGLSTGEGIYRHTNVNNREFTINFDYPGFIPPSGSLIKVIYDNTVPIKVFGGDSLIGESIFSPIDMEYNDGGGLSDYNTNENAFGLFNGWPYYRFEISPRVYVVNDASASINKIQDDNTINMDFIRQMSVMFTCETRVDQALYFSGSTPNQFFPHIHYVMRPHGWDTSDPTINIQEQYFDDYPSEQDRWIYGGIRYLPEFNIDYSKENIERAHSSKPKVGFEEETLFCTMDTWSAKRPINVQDAPGVRTFPVANRFIVSDNRGEIKYAWSSSSDKGHNLYAVCEEGTVLLLTNKTTLSNIQGDELTLIGGEETDVIQEQVWLSGDIGMNDEMWRSYAENDNALYWANNNSVYKLFNNQIEDVGRIKYHSKLYNDSLKIIAPGFQDDVTGVFDTLHNEYWIQVINNPTKKSFATSLSFGTYTNGPPIDCPISENEVFDLVGINDNPFVILPNASEGIDKITICNAGTNTITVVDPDSTPSPAQIVSSDDTTYTPFSIQPGECYEFIKGTYTFPNAGGITFNYVGSLLSSFIPNSNLFVFSEITKHWVGEFGYRFDEYLSFDGKTFGFRSGQTFELNKGNQISGANITADVLQASAKEQIWGKEFIRIRVASDNKPTRVEFFNNLNQTNVQAELDPSNSQFYLKDYDGFEQYIPRKLASVDPARPRMQGRLLIYKILHNLAESFKIVDAATQYKILK